MPSVADPIDWLDDALVHRPEHPFLRTPEGRELSYAALCAQAARIAAVLSMRGVTAGDRVAVQVDKSADAVLLYVACLAMGAVYVPINAANTANEVEYFLCDAEPRLAVVRPADPQVLEGPAERAGVRHLETLGTHGEGSLPQLLRDVGDPGAGAAPIASPGSGPAWRRPEWRRPEWIRTASAPAAIVYTSGTTGRPKGAVLTRGNLAANAAALADAWRFTPDDVLLHTLPLFHVHGLFAALNTVLASGSSLLLMPAFDAAAVVARLPEVTVYMGVPTHYTRLLQERSLDRAAAAAVRLFVSGSAPLRAATHREFERRTGHTILERYGMTETLMITSNPYDGARLPGSVGPALPGVSVRVHQGPRSVGPAPPGVSEREHEGSGSDGGLEVKGPNVFSGYWRDPGKTRGEFTPDGWFKTGDIGRIDAAGYVYIVGRAKDLVITGGYNVYPKEVELELDAVPGVRESAVFGVPHPDFGEGVTAAVVGEPDARLSEAQVIGAVRARLAGYKIPKRVVFVDELPRNTMGKIQKNSLRARFASLYGG